MSEVERAASTPNRLMTLGPRSATFWSVELAQTLPALGQGAADQAVLAIRVADLDVTAAELRARGARLLGEPTISWGRLKLVHLRDPEQNLIELQQWLAPASAS